MLTALRALEIPLDVNTNSYLTAERCKTLTCLLDVQFFERHFHIIIRSSKDSSISMGSVEKPATVRVAVTQHEPVWLDLQGTVSKTCKIIDEASKAGAKLVAFPEVWVPGYPAWIWYLPTFLLTICPLVLSD